MIRFILITFAFLGWSFYEMSGGSEFDPSKARLTNVKEDPLKPVQVAQLPKSEPKADVTRVSLNLTSVNDVLGTKAKPASKPVVTRVKAVEPEAEPTIILPSLIADVDTPAVQPQPEPTETVLITDVRVVSGSRVNVRGGPGTSFQVVNKLVQGDEVEILEDNGSGWVLLRPVSGGPTGWMADFLLSEG